MKKIVAPIIIAVLIIGSGAFYGGMKYAQSKNADGAFRGMNRGGASGTIGGFGGMRGGLGMGAGSGLVMGEVLSKDDKSVTLKLRDGGSKIIFFSDSTQIMKTGEGSAKDLVVGQQLSVAGSMNSDGSTNAQMIQIRPAQPVVPIGNI